MFVKWYTLVINYIQKHFGMEWEWNGLIISTDSYFSEGWNHPPDGVFMG